MNLPLKSLWFTLLLGPCWGGLAAQAPAARDAAELQRGLDKLQVLGSILYVAAHPDDENTAALACFSKGLKLRTAYLSLTRGGGGQNLIGPEREDALAALRTQELLAARRLDGAEQYFTRAVDFGFSKTARETLAIWGQEAVLGEVVWTFRKLRPDVIVTRFSPVQNGTHGHHTASAMLALEAFQAAADPKRFPEQLAFVRPWQATRIVWNAYRSPQGPQAPAPANAVSLDVGQYDPLAGKAYTELAAESRSLHRSQGFGSLAGRGSRLEPFEPLAGPVAKNSLLEGVDLTWARVPGATQVATLLAAARQAYRPERPAAILPLLLQAKAALDRLPKGPWVEIKGRELLEAIRCAAGLWVEAIADRPLAAPGTTVTVTATALARAGGPITLAAIGLSPLPEPRALGRTLALNQPLAEVFQVALPPSFPSSQPFWMAGTRTAGLDAVQPWPLAGQAEGPAPLTATFSLSAEGVPFELTVPVQVRFRDPVLGERDQWLAVGPAVRVEVDEPVQLFADAGGREIALTLVAGRAGAQGALRLQVPAGWRVEPAELPFALAQAGQQVRMVARITPPAAPQTGELGIQVAIDGQTTPAQGLVRVDYPHIPQQTFFPSTRVRLVRLDLARAGRRIGYVMGAQDDVPRCLRPLGYTVELLTDEALAGAELSGFDAILVGIRAFNTRDRLAQLNPRLLAYAAQGGTLVVQYSVDQGLVTPDLGPYPFKVSRTRVCEEAAPVAFLAPGHPVLTWPNRITAADFDGWVQERGLQFAQDWDARYTPILATHDTGEPPSGGGLLVARHGKGVFVYTGLSFFRQLPAGVPGAYRLFANILALGHFHD